jgi:hypothetical protein
LDFEHRQGVTDHAMRHPGTITVGECGQPAINFFGHCDPFDFVPSYWHEF